MTSGMDLSLVLACYNEGGILVPSVREICAELDNSKWSYELILVDDHSRDETPQNVRKLADEMPGVRAVLHDQNMGRGRTVRDGLDQARGRFIGYIDVDLEVHARYIPAHLRALEEGADMALAYRVYRINPYPVPFIRHILSRGYAALSRRVLGLRTKDSESGFKFFRKESYDRIKDSCADPGWFWDTELVYFAEKSGMKVAEIPCLFLRRSDKVSKLNVIPDTIRYARNLYSFARKKKI
ncbi:glycosyltransferase [bacterium]|nr:glycosyltransferase [bacterium]